MLVSDITAVLHQLSNDDLYRLFSTVLKLKPKQIGNIERVPIHVNMLYDMYLHGLRSYLGATIQRRLDVDSDGT